MAESPPPPYTPPTSSSDPVDLPEPARIQIGTISVSQDTVRFLQINGSPFTDRMGMGPMPVRVTDPRSRDLTGDFQLSCTLNVAIPNAGAAQSSFFATMSMNPYMNQGFPFLSNLIVPNDDIMLSQLYEGNKMVGSPVEYFAWLVHRQDPAFLRQFTDFFVTSRRFRVVGCGMKFNADVPPTFQQMPGRLEAGHFDELAAVQAMGIQDPVLPAPLGKSVWPYNHMPHGFFRRFNQWDPVMPPGENPFSSDVMQNWFNDFMWPFREPGYSILEAKDGCTIRGVQRAPWLLIPMRSCVPVADVSLARTTAFFTGTPANWNYDYAANVSFGKDIYPSHGMMQPNVPMLPWFDGGDPRHRTIAGLALADKTDVDYALSDTCGLDGFLADYGDLLTYTGLDNAVLGPSLYVRGDGFTPGTTGQLRFVWHLEYVPNAFDTTLVTPSPVDGNFELALAVVSDPAAMPFVTKGHSFFRKLFQIAGAIARVALKVMQVSSILGGR